MFAKPRTKVIMISLWLKLPSRDIMFFLKERGIAMVD
jgi:hypothetical protein